jgi:glucose/arabinose dehydrogenase
MKKNYIAGALTVCFLASACANRNPQEQVRSSENPGTITPQTQLPEPFETRSAVNFSKVQGWKDGEKPVAPEGFTVTKFADGLKSVRWIYVLPNGDVLVSQANTEAKGVEKVGKDIAGYSKSIETEGSPNKITLLRDANHDGSPEISETFLSNLNQPFGMLLIKDAFYVAVTDGLWKYPYETDALSINKTGQKILELPAGGYNNHWTRNLITNGKQSKIYISVGSASNVAEHGIEHEIRRASILEINPDGSGERIYASGLRNPVGMAWIGGGNPLWTVVNERDKLGDDLVPDYLTSVKDGGFYGWPYSYFGAHIDPRIDEKDQRPDLVSQAIVPDVSLGAHTASLGLAYYAGGMYPAQAGKPTAKTFPGKYAEGMFIGQHGSWNRKELSGYKVVFVPFKNGKVSGPPEDFLTGFFISEDKVHGRPVGVAVLPDGSLLVADDASGVIWQVAYKR